MIEFGDDVNAGETLRTSCVYVWERIGPQLCEHFGNGIEFVREKTPSPIDRFIFELDRSDSMNERTKISTGSTTSIGQRSDTAA